MMIDKACPSVRRYMSERIFDADFHTKLAYMGFDQTPREFFKVIDVMKYYSKRKFNESISYSSRYMSDSARNGYI